MAALLDAEPSIEAAERQVLSEFESLGENWQLKYEYLIEIGSRLSSLEDKFKTKERLIKGCQSQVWLYTTFRDSKVYYEADGDAPIPKGLVALMIRVLSGHSAHEIVSAKLDFVEKIGLTRHLSPTRSTGLSSMIEQMKFQAEKIARTTASGQ